MQHIISISILLIGFYLGLYNNNLTIFEDGKPIITLPYHSEIYPTEDQERLREGIPFETNDELSALLEDFIS